MKIIRNNDPIGTIRTAKKAFELFKEAQKNATPEERAAWADKAYQDRWKNLGGTCLFTLITGAGVYAEILWRNNFPDPISWAILFGLNALLLAIGIASVVKYIWMIVKGK